MTPGRPTGDDSAGIATRSAVPWICLAALSAVTVLLVFWAYVPLNMDEFVSYQTLAALRYPGSAENVFCSNPASFYLNVLGRFRLPLLTYDYIGSLSSLLYAPVFLLWSSPMSARLTGVLALLIQAIVIARMFRFRASVVFCCLIFFVPYSFVHLADTGPVAFQVTSVFIVCHLLHQWILSRRGTRRAAMMALAGFVIALACWVKPTYFFASAGIALTALAGFLFAWLRRPGERLRRTAEYLLLLVCAAIPAALVYEAKHADGSPYLPVISHNFVPGQVQLEEIGRRFQENVLHFLLNPLDATILYFDNPPRSVVWTVATCLLAGALALGGVCGRGINFRHRLEMLANYGLFALALLLVATNIYAKSMHHAVLAYPFAILAVARGLRLQPRGKFLKLVLAAFILLNGSLLFQFRGMSETAVRNSSSKAYVAQLNDDLNGSEAKGSVIACVDWGIYFVQALYGPRSQVVLFLCGSYDEQPLDQAAAIARRLHRNLTVVGLDGNRNTPARLRAGVPEMQERAAAGTGNPWRIWRIPYARLANLPPQAFAAPGPPSP